VGVAICGLLSTQLKKCKTVKYIQRASGKVSMSDPILGAAQHLEKTCFFLFTGFCTAKIIGDTAVYHPAVAGETNLSITGSDAKIVALQP
jgi:hypothetical protein